MSKYKIGDRVYFKGSEYQNPDYGTVIEKTRSYGDVWAVWDSDGNGCHFAEDDPDFQLVENMKEMDIERLKRGIEELQDLVKEQSGQINDLRLELRSLWRHIEDNCALK